MGQLPDRFLYLLFSFLLLYTVSCLVSLFYTSMICCLLHLYSMNSPSYFTRFLCFPSLFLLFSFRFLFIPTLSHLFFPLEEFKFYLGLHDELMIKSAKGPMAITVADW